MQDIQVQVMLPKVEHLVVLVEVAVQEIRAQVLLVLLLVVVEILLP